MLPTDDAYRLRRADKIMAGDHIWDDALRTWIIVRDVERERSTVWIATDPKMLTLPRDQLIPVLDDNQP